MTTKQKHPRLRWAANPNTVLKKLRTKELEWLDGMKQARTQSEYSRCENIGRGIGMAKALIVASTEEIT